MDRIGQVRTGQERDGTGAGWEVQAQGGIESTQEGYIYFFFQIFILFYFFSNFCYIILHLNAFNEFIFSGMFLIFVLADHMYSNRNIQW